MSQISFSTLADIYDAEVGTTFPSVLLKFLFHLKK